MKRPGTTEALTAIYASDASIEVKKAVINALFIQSNATGLVTLARAEKNVELKKDIVSEAVEHEVEGSDGLSHGVTEMIAELRQGHQGGQRTPRVFAVSVLFVALCVLVAAPAQSQGRISNAKTETRSAAQGLDREVRAAEQRSGVTWIGYRMPMVAGPRQMCCYDTISDSSFSGGMCRLESGGGVSMNTGDFRDRNGTRITLEPATEFLVMARLEGGAGHAGSHLHARLRHRRRPRCRWSG